MAKTIIDMKGIVKKFYIGQPNELTILKGIDLVVEEGEFVSIVGQSGSGKSTLMNIIGALDSPTEGEYLLDGVSINGANDTQLSAIRNEKIGFVFQTFNLIPRTSALKNVELPMLYASVPRSKRTARAKELLRMVQMDERMSHMPNELSGGQKQRVANSPAMANHPALHRADAPPGPGPSPRFRPPRPGHHPGRRADRRARFLHRTAGDGPVPQAAPRAGQDHRAHHPQPGAGRGDPAGRHHPGRPGGGCAPRQRGPAAGPPLP